MNWGRLGVGLMILEGKFAAGDTVLVDVPMKGRGWGNK